MPGLSREERTDGRGSMHSIVKTVYNELAPVGTLPVSGRVATPSLAQAGVRMSLLFRFLNAIMHAVNYKALNLVSKRKPFTAEG